MNIDHSTAVEAIISLRTDIQKMAKTAPEMLCNLQAKNRALVQLTHLCIAYWHERGVKYLPCFRPVPGGWQGKPSGAERARGL